MKRFQIVILLIILVGLSCEERDNYDDNLSSKLNVITALRGNATEANIDHIQGKIELTLPPRTDITDVSLTIEAPEGVTISPVSGTSLDLTNRVEVMASFNGSVRTYQLIARVLPSQIAFLGEEDTFENLLAAADDDIAVAAQWVKDTYAEDFVYLSANTVSIEQLEEVNVVVFYYDQLGSSVLPTVFTEGSTKSAFIQYLVEGGKMLLGGMATSYAAAIGRDESALLTVRRNGPDQDLNVVWGVDGGVNFVTSKLNHPIYTFNEGLIEYDSNGFIPVIDEGVRENHNNLWDAKPLLEAGHQLGQFNEFERLYGGIVLGVWSGVRDECCPGIVEFTPRPPYTGTIIAIGVGGMEWNMNDGRVNRYDGNIKGIYKNAIDYLQTK